MSTPRFLKRVWKRLLSPSEPIWAHLSPASWAACCKRKTTDWRSACNVAFGSNGSQWVSPVIGRPKVVSAVSGVRGGSVGDLWRLHSAGQTFYHSSSGSYWNAFLQRTRQCVEQLSTSTTCWNHPQPKQVQLLFQHDMRTEWIVCTHLLRSVATNYLWNSVP